MGGHERNKKEKYPQLELQLNGRSNVKAYLSEHTWYAISIYFSRIGNLNTWRLEHNKCDEHGGGFNTTCLSCLVRVEVKLRTDTTD